MRRLVRATGLLIAALSLGACQYVFPLDVVQRDGKLLIWTEREWKWFLIPERPRLKVSCIEVWSGQRWMWRVEAPQGREIQLPIAYGEGRAGLTVLDPPQPLRPGTGYVARVDRASGRTFRLSSTGALVDVGASEWEDSPDDKIENEQRRKRIDELRVRGMTEGQAFEAWHKERSAVATSPCGRSPATATLKS